ncbi:MAG: pyridoxamine 5'-phosphate oxidase [Alphaproteobacteria bacterium]|nr:pyridoxamine 5'-phosphate oxidase [Alphaproteobacteria bacterium]
MTFSSDVAFTPTVKAIQARRGSRQSYERMEAKGGWATTVDDELAQFLAAADSFYLATATAAGQPYIQHRGGPPGFLRVLDERTLGFADFKGNRQYISTGNLAENPLAFIFVVDYANRRRIKIWGTARVVEADPVRMERLFPAGYAAKPDQAILFSIAAWDSNCPQYIPQKISADDVAAMVEGYERKVALLESEVARLRAKA